MSITHPDVARNGDDADTPPSRVITAPVVKLEASDAGTAPCRRSPGARPGAAAGSAPGVLLEGGDVPRLGDVGEERPDHDPVATNGRSE
jgi:hypothetical protein